MNFIYYQLGSSRMQAAEMQQTFYTLFGNRDWDELIKTYAEFNHKLQLKISFALFTQSYANCTSDQKTRIDWVISQVVKLSGTSRSVFINYTYVITMDSVAPGILPLVRVKVDDKVYYLETEYNSIYEDWNEYLKQDEFVKHKGLAICYPKDGIYKCDSYGRVMIDYRVFQHYDLKGETPSQTRFFKPLDSWLFFPFSESIFAEVNLRVRKSTKYVTLKKLDHAVKISNKDLDSLAIWFKITSPYFGNISNEETDQISWNVDTPQATSAIELFNSFYDSMYSVNGCFVVVHLMKLVAIGDGKLDMQLLKDFSSMLEFISNISLSANDVEKMVEILIANPSRLRNIFKVTSRRSGLEVAKIENLQGDIGIACTLDLITKSVKEDCSFTRVMKELALVLPNIFVVKNNQVSASKEYYGYSRLRGLIRDSFDTFSNETKNRRTYLIELLEESIGCEEFLKNILDYPADVLMVVFNSVKKVSSALQPPQMREVYEKQFLKFALNFHKSLQDEPVYIGNVFSFITDKFIIKFQTFFVQNERENPINSDWDVENLFYNFIRSMGDRRSMKEMWRECSEICEITNNCNGRTMRILDVKGIRIEGILFNRFAGTLLESFPFFRSSEEIICNYLGINTLPKNAVYKDHHVTVFSENSKQVVCINLDPFNQTRVHPAELDKPDYLGLFIKYALSTN